MVTVTGEIGTDGWNVKISLGVTVWMLVQKFWNGAERSDHALFRSKLAGAVVDDNAPEPEEIEYASAVRPAFGIAIMIKAISNIPIVVFIRTVL